MNRAGWVREVAQDAAHAFRVYLRHPVFSLSAITALALGIGGATGVFSVLYALLLRPLPFRDAHQLVALQGFPAPAVGGSKSLFENWLRASNYLQDAALFSPQEMNLGTEQLGARVRVAHVSANFFRVLGTEPAVGRVFGPEEDTPGQNHVAVIGRALWTTHFGADPNIVGRTIRLDGVGFEIIGVAAGQMDYPGRTQVWLPTVFEPNKFAKAQAAYFWNITGRLRSDIGAGVARELYEAELARIAPRSLSQDPDLRPRLVPLQRQLASLQRTPTLLLFGAVLLVLLIACTNVANLMLSRTLDRRHEFAIRAALGAKPERLTRQLLTESVVLSVLGGCAGIPFAVWSCSLLARFSPPALIAQAPRIDWRMLLFAQAVAVVSGLLFGALPALHGSRAGHLLSSHLSNGKGGRARAALVAAQVSVSIVLLTGAVSLGGALLKLLRVDLGYQTPRVVTVRVSLVGTRREKEATRYYAEALERIRSIPGIRAAGGAAYLPLTRDPLAITAHKLDIGQPSPAIAVSVTPGYFETMNTPLLAGRLFTDADSAAAEPVAIVTDNFARRVADPATVVGRYLFSGSRKVRVVGVVKTLRHLGPGADPLPQVYLPVQQAPWPYLTFVASTADPKRMLPRVRDTISSVDRQVPVYDSQTLDERLQANLAQTRFYTTVLLFFAAFAVFLVLLGAFSLAEREVTRRMHEIGVRLALGATPARVRSLVLIRAIVPIAAGALAGAAAILPAGTLLRSLVANTAPPDWKGVAVIGCCLLIAAAVSVWSATLRIVRIDEARLLRVE
ncbi:MAG: ADOP family duplicated permease [Rhodospirillales bacterium]